MIGWVVSSMLAALPALAVPAWLSAQGPALSGVLGAASSMGAWVPVQLAVTVLASVLACIAAGLGIKIVRVVVSLFTGGGGSAA